MDQTVIKSIPEELIYEMIKGKALYYRGYEAVLNGEKTSDEIMGSSQLQAFLVAEIVFILKTVLGKEYLIFTNELGIKFSKSHWRAADIALVKGGRLKTLNDKYLEEAPDMVFEIDTKGALLDLEDPFAYHHEKTEDLLTFGVKKVVWIFTSSKKIMLAEKGKDWITKDWTQDLQVYENLSLNIGAILAESNLDLA